MTEVNIDAESAAFDRLARERIAHGFVPDLRRLVKVDWFYNNVWRDPEFVNIHWMPRINNIIKRAREKGGKVLEVGCGMGPLSLELARNGLHVTGVDLSPYCISVANKYRLKNEFLDGFGSLDYICGDIMAIDVDKYEYDTVIFFRSLHHFPALKNLIIKISNSLKDNGMLILSEPIRANFTQDSALLAAIMRMLLPTWQTVEEKMALTGDASFFDGYVKDIYEEYVFENKHEQSPLDNSVNSSDIMINFIKEHFNIIEENYSDAFIDKIIGGLRGEQRYILARFLKFLDDYMIKNRKMPPTSLELVAIKRQQ